MNVSLVASQIGFAKGGVTARRYGADVVPPLQVDARHVPLQVLPGRECAGADLAQELAPPPFAVHVIRVPPQVVRVARHEGAPVARVILNPQVGGLLVPLQVSPFREAFAARGSDIVVVGGSLPRVDGSHVSLAVLQPGASGQSGILDTKYGNRHLPST